MTHCKSVPGWTGLPAFWPMEGRSWLVCAMVLLLGCLPQEASARKIEQIATPGGIKIWLVREPAIPLVAMRFAFEGGALQDPAGKEGLAATMAALLSEGAGALDASAFARRLADAGAQLSFSAARDQIYGGLDVLSKRLAEASEPTRLALSQPRFDADAIERTRGQRIADLEISANEPRSIAFNRWYAEVFAGHVYGRPVNGALVSLRAIQREDLVRQHRRLLARSGLRIVIVGDIDDTAAIAAVDRLFGGLPAVAELDALAKPMPRSLGAPVVVEKDQPLATAAFGAEALPTEHADFPALEVLRQIVGSGDFDSTLMDEIRVKRGLAYSVSLSLIHDAKASILLGGMATKSENMDEARRVLMEVLGRIATQGPAQEPFANAKRYLTGSYLLDFDTNAKLASSLLKLWLEGRPSEYVAERNARIDRVTLDDVKRVARQVLDPARLSMTIVGRKAPAQ